MTVPQLARARAVSPPNYRFEGKDGPALLADLLGGRQRLAVYHTMPDHSGPDDVVAAAEIADALHDPGTRLVLVSRAPYAKLEQYRRHFGWDLPAYSAAGTRFTTDFAATRRVPGATGGEFWDDEGAGLTFFRGEGGSLVHTGSVAVPRLDFLGLLGLPDRIVPGRHHG
jgi:predicted dithiol-disulfide oxidoreductase (DUF899 family)